jgi:aryl-alcohol dehydrogenase-like predicted oxidoreductase
VSNFDVNQLERGRKVAQIVSVQNEYNIGDLSSEPVLKACEKLGIAFLPWYPLGAGAVLKSSRISSLSMKLKATPAQAALAWLLAKSPVMLPIPGTGSLAHLEENVAALKLELSKEDL